MRVAPELGIGFDGGLVEEEEEEEEEEMMLMLMLPPPLVGEVWAEGEEEDDEEEEEEKDVLERWWATCLACERRMRLLDSAATESAGLLHLSHLLGKRAYSERVTVEAEAG